MPGFYVSSVKEGGFNTRAISTRDYYYNYTWEIENLFETEIPNNETNALIYAKEITLPSFVAMIDNVQGASLQYKHAKSITWEDVKITWYDNVGLLKIMQKWRKSIWDENLGLQPIDRYKKTSKINSFLPNGTFVNSWTLINSWPSTIRYGDLTYSSSDVKLVSVTVTYDWASESGATTFERNEIGTPSGSADFRDDNLLRF